VNPSVDQSNVELLERVRLLEASNRRLVAAEEVRRLQNAYGYYMDLLLYEQVVPLFSANAEVRFMGGIFRGTAGVERLFLDNLGGSFTRGSHGPVYGRMGEHLMLQEVISVSPDGQSAKARVRHLLKAGLHQTALALRDEIVTGGGVNLEQWIEGGYYENEYALENGVWKFTHLDYRIQYYATVEHGWAYTPTDYAPWFRVAFPEDPIGPDALVDPVPTVWPSVVAVPFHYPNPVTGLETEIRVQE
jgi:hypothetical protein